MSMQKCNWWLFDDGSRYGRRALVVRPSPADAGSDMLGGGLIDPSGRQVLIVRRDLQNFRMEASKSVEDLQFHLSQTDLRLSAVES